MKGAEFVAAYKGWVYTSNSLRRYVRYSWSVVGKKRQNVASSAVPRLRWLPMIMRVFLPREFQV